MEKGSRWAMGVRPVFKRFKEVFNFFRCEHFPRLGWALHGHADKILQNNTAEKRIQQPR